MFGRKSKEEPKYETVKGYMIERPYLKVYTRFHEMVVNSNYMSFKEATKFNNNICLVNDDFMVTVTVAHGLGSISVRKRDINMIEIATDLLFTEDVNEANKMEKKGYAVGPGTQTRLVEEK